MGAAEGPAVATWGPVPESQVGVEFQQSCLHLVRLHAHVGSQKLNTDTWVCRSPPPLFFIRFSYQGHEASILSTGLKRKEQHRWLKKTNVLLDMVSFS